MYHRPVLSPSPPLTLLPSPAPCQHIAHIAHQFHVHLHPFKLCQPEIKCKSSRSTQLSQELRKQEARAPVEVLTDFHEVLSLKKSRVAKKPRKPSQRAFREFPILIKRGPRQPAYNGTPKARSPFFYRFDSGALLVSPPTLIPLSSLITSLSCLHLPDLAIAPAPPVDSKSYTLPTAQPIRIDQTVHRTRGCACEFTDVRAVLLGTCQYVEHAS